MRLVGHLNIWDARLNTPRLVDLYMLSVVLRKHYSDLSSKFTKMGVWIGTGALLLMTMGNSTFGRQVDLPHADVVDGVRVNYKPYEDTWTAFKKTFERRYVTDVEDKSRFVLLAENLKMMEQHNRKYVAGKESYFVDINDFTDRTDAEIRSMYYGHLNVVHQEDHHTRSITGCTSYVPSTVENLPTHVDWREKDCVTPVKNQGLCGSCYAFGSIASLETQMCKETGNLTELSEQQVVDCCGQGCDGGDGVTVFKCLRKLGGVMSAADYPYVAKQENCSFIKDKSKVMVAGCKSVDGESAKKFAVALVGPLYSAIIADGPLLRYYKGGIFNDTTCSGDVNHAITIVGYGTEGNTPIWIVKNSWGVDTGVQGYLKIKRGDNICNIESSTSYFPVAQKVVTPVPVIGLITSQPSNAEKEGLRTWLLLPAIALLVLCCWYNRRFLIIVLKRVIRCYHFV